MRINKSKNNKNKIPKQETYVFNKCPPFDPLMRAYIHPFRLVLDSSRSSKREREKVLQYE